ncbi:hypothetical protein PCK2_000145 [Pneumocystis canis]|nr:hypothetical protein PCK2_000145 [Pneumocystis canis]
MNHSNPYIRKRVVLLIYKIFLQYPDALKSPFLKLREKLEDIDQSVVYATVNVICELSMKNPKNYLLLAPILYNLLKTSSNNWILIKLIKIFSSMIPLESRLIRKLAPILTMLIQNVSAMSLRYECINIIVTGNFLKNDSDSLTILIEIVTFTVTILFLLKDRVKYVGLLILSKVMVVYPILMPAFEDIIFECLEDDDISIQLRALDLVGCLVNKENLQEIVKFLVTQLVLPHSPLSKNHRNYIVNKILLISSKDSYINISDFDWYISVLINLVKISKVNVSEMLGIEMQNVSVRVKIARPYAVNRLSKLLYDADLVDNIYDSESNIGVLSYVAWIVGEYSSLLDSYHEVLESMLQFKVLNFPASIQKIYVQAIPKIFINWMFKSAYWDIEKKIASSIWIQKIVLVLDEFCISKDLEVLQRAVEFKEVFKMVQYIIEFADYDSSFLDTNEFLSPNQFSNASNLVYFLFNDVLFAMFLDNLNPVAPNAQKKIPVLENINLENWIYSPPNLRSNYDSIFINDFQTEKNIKNFSNNLSFGEYLEVLTKKKERFYDDPFYISGNILPCSPIFLEDKNEFNDIPVVKLEILDISGKRRRNKEKNIQVNVVLGSVDIIPDEVPENVIMLDSENEKKQLLKVSIDDEENNMERLNKIEEIKEILKDSNKSHKKTWE